MRILATEEGRLYVTKLDFFSDPKIIQTLRELNNSRLVKKLRTKKT
jgi:hypothetical protein